MTRRSWLQAAAGLLAAIVLPTPVPVGRPTQLVYYTAALRVGTLPRVGTVNPISRTVVTGAAATLDLVDGRPLWRVVIDLSPLSPAESA